MPSRQSRNGDLHQERRSSSPSSDFKFGLLTLCCFLLTSLLLMLVLGWTTSARESSQMRTSALLTSGDLQFFSCEKSRKQHGQKLHSNKQKRSNISNQDVHSSIKYAHFHSKMQKNRVSAFTGKSQYSQHENQHRWRLCGCAFL